MWSVTQLLLVRILDWLAESGTGSPQHGPLFGSYIGLYQTGTPAVGPSSVMSSIVEATYHGYARQEIAWYPVYQSSGGLVTLEGGSLYFAPTDSVVPNTITGVFLADALTGGDLFAGQPLAAPGQVLDGPLSVVKVLPNFGLGYGPVYGGCLIET